MTVFVTVITITDRCDFDHTLMTRAMLGACAPRARAWGDAQCASMLADKAIRFGETGDMADDPATYDPHASVSVVEVI